MCLGVLLVCFLGVAFRASGEFLSAREKRVVLVCVFCLFPDHDPKSVRAHVFVFRISVLSPLTDVGCFLRCQSFVLKKRLWHMCFFHGFSCLFAFVIDD